MKDGLFWMAAPVNAGNMSAPACSASRFIARDCSATTVPRRSPRLNAIAFHALARKKA
jgi:hypothetical protein